MDRDLKHVGSVRTINVSSLFRTDSKLDLFTPKSVLKIPKSTKSTSKSLKKSFMHHSSSKSVLEFSKKQTPTNLSLNKQTPNLFNKKLSKEKVNKQKKVILIRHNSNKNLSTAHSKSTISLKNRSIQSSVKSKVSQSQHIAPSTTRTSSFKQQSDSAQFLIDSEIEFQKSKAKQVSYCSSNQYPQNLNQQFLKKRADMYQMFSNLDQKFNRLEESKQKIKAIRPVHQSSVFSQNSIVQKMNQLSLENSNDIMSLIKNKIISPSQQTMPEKQNGTSLFQSNKINKVYVSSYKKRNG